MFLFSLKLLDRSFNLMTILLCDIYLDIGHRRDIGAHSVVNKTVTDNSHTLFNFFT